MAKKAEIFKKAKTKIKTKVQKVTTKVKKAFSQVNGDALNLAETLAEERRSYGRW